MVTMFKSIAYMFYFVSASESPIATRDTNYLFLLNDDYNQL